MKSVSVSFPKVDKFVEDNKSRGVDVFWDGYNMVFFKSDPTAFKKITGKFRNGVWGETTTIKCDDQGFWNVPVKLVSIR